MKFTYDRFVIITVILLGSALVTWLLLIRPGDFVVSDYVPSDTEGIISYVPHSNSAGFPGVLGDFEQQLALQVDALSAAAKQKIVAVHWAYDSHDQEYLFILFSPTLTAKEREYLASDIWPQLPLQQTKPQVTWLSHHWLLLTALPYEKSQVSLSANTALLATERLSVYLRRPASIVGFTKQTPLSNIFSAIDDKYFPMQFYASVANDITKVTLLQQHSTDGSTSAAESILIPESAEVYARLTPDMIDWLQVWPMVEAFWRRYLPLTQAMTIDDIQQVKYPLELFVSGDQWLLSGHNEDMTALIQRLSFGFGWKQKIGTLPDGSAYREIIRASQQSTSSQWQGKTLQHWSSADRSLFYLSDTSTSAWIANSQDVFDSRAIFQPDNQFIEFCQAPLSQGEGFIWLKGQLPSVIGSYVGLEFKNVALLEVANEKYHGLSLCFR